MDRLLPFESGVYSVRPGLRLLDGPATSVENFDRYRREKLAACAKRETYIEQGLRDDTRRAAARKLAELLSAEHPEHYAFNGQVVECRLTGDAVALNREALRRLPMRMTEDVAVMQLDGERDALVMGNICLPSSWRLEEKIGRPFVEVHAPVPGIPLEGAGAIVRSLATKGPYERFAWGLTNFDVLDQEAGVHADVQPQPLFVRVERQTTHPLPECDAWIFLIHPENVSVERLSREQRHLLARAVESMSDEQAAYKGLCGTRQAVIAALSE